MNTSKLSTSIQRQNFRKINSLSRSENAEKDAGLFLAELVFQDKILQAEIEKENDPEWQKDNLEFDLRSTDWILEKVRNSDEYAKMLYSTLCNNEFIKNQVFDILKEKTWSCSWRYAGGIIAHMRQEGDYIDWYLSGAEGQIYDEIKEDLLKLGWTIKD